MSESLETPKITFFNEKPFYITLIDDNDFDLKQFDWNHPNYVQLLVSQPFIKTLQVTSENFFMNIQNLLNVNQNNLVVTETIGEEPLHNYQLIYLDKNNNQNKMNQFATLLNTNGEVICGKAIVVRNYIPTLTNSNKFEDMDSSALYNMLRNRGFNKFVVWDDESEKWREEEVYGSMEIYAKKFFDNEAYKTCEMAFLKHNLNIWYLRSDYGQDNVCGSLLNCKIEKVLIFTMLTNDIRGNITKDEVEKIIKLSQVLNPPFKPDNKWFEDEKDEYGRTIVKNKYRILDNVFQENFKI
jgi:hypothetical protein